MAFDPRLGTFLGQPIALHDGFSKPQVGSMVWKDETHEMMLYTGTAWVSVEMDSLPLTGIAAQTPSLSDEYLEEQYEELKELKEIYNAKRDELKVFEILKLDEST